jgi:hypothetical protein
MFLAFPQTSPYPALSFAERSRFRAETFLAEAIMAIEKVGELPQTFGPNIDHASRWQ